MYTKNKYIYIYIYKKSFNGIYIYICIYKSIYKQIYNAEIYNTEYKYILNNNSTSSESPK